MDESEKLEVFTKWIRKIPCNNIRSICSDWYNVTEQNKEILKQIKIDRLTIEYSKSGKLFRSVITF